MWSRISSGKSWNWRLLVAPVLFEVLGLAWTGGSWGSCILRISIGEDAGLWVTYKRGDRAELMAFIKLIWGERVVSMLVTLHNSACQSRR
jgi:hypothetical protein